ncbi:OLC1v1011444C1 [Oldenlandia corymbosa var. corymbosa]|uniref:Large ribosomal subunit protein bL12c n=1 Tax=Oldenlandia corymbosa var. corymbosa TaxID=529605 RepID=A0AAV1DWP1_OLDCO|nr:OLC1v1011444C1 [Oldenlandia corymbosa var. corymbosa]
MSSVASKIASKSLLKQVFRLSQRALSTSTEPRTQKLERIADELLSLTKIEKHDYAILFRHKLGLNRYGPAVSGISDPSSGSAASGPGAGAADAQAAEKTIFNVKLEKFDAAAKIKVIKEIRGITDLGLKEAKDLVEKAPSVVKKGVTKDEADAIIEKLQKAGATAALE